MTYSSSKNPWFYLPAIERQDEPFELLSISSNLQLNILDKIDDFKEQAALEETCALFKNWIEKNGYVLKAKRVGIDEVRKRSEIEEAFQENEYIITENGEYTNLAVFTERNIQITTEILDISYSDENQIMGQQRLSEVLNRIEANRLKARRFTFNIPLQSTDFFNSLVAITKPKEIIFSSAGGLECLEYLKNDYVYEKLDCLFIPDYLLWIEEAEILKYKAKELSIEFGILTSNGLFQMVKQIIQGEREAVVIRIGLASQNYLTAEDFLSASNELERHYPVEKISKHTTCFSRLHDQKRFKIVFSPTVITISEDWMLF